MRRSIVTLLLILAGCAGRGMSEAECRLADWRAIGFEDGARGADASAFGARRRACAEFDVSPSFELYLTGHAQGLETFCRPENGGRLGAQGYRYTGVCPDPLEEAFLSAYTRSFGLFERRSTLETLTLQLRTTRDRAGDVEAAFVQKTAQVVSSHLPPAERIALAMELKQLAEERAELERRVGELELARIEAEQEYERYESRIEPPQGE